MSEDHKNYVLSNWEEGDTVYLGYEDKDGAWIVKKYVIATGVVTFCRGEHDYASNWTGRAALTYSTYATAY